MVWIASVIPVSLLNQIPECALLWEMDQKWRITDFNQCRSQQHHLLDSDLKKNPIIKPMSLGHFMCIKVHFTLHNEHHLCSFSLRLVSLQDITKDPGCGVELTCVLTIIYSLCPHQWRLCLVGTWNKYKCNTEQLESWTWYWRKPLIEKRQNYMWGWNAWQW